MTVLDLVRQFRSNLNSTLEAGALLLTCDYSLYKFDWETSRKMGIMPCTVLPNLFWQILRPFIPADVDFSRSFAETFAIPEFRTIGSGSSEACSKMLNILASYKGLSEETAAKMLSNDLLIDQLRIAENDQEFQEYIESAIVAENADLAEEKAALTGRLETERIGKQKAEEQLQQEREQHQIYRAKAEELQQRFEQTGVVYKGQIEKIFAEVESEKKLRKAAEEKNFRLEERTKTIFRAELSILISTVAIAFFELLTNLLPWKWLVNHPNSYGLQASVDIVIILGILGFFIPRWRKWCWILAALPIIIGSLQLLGGPKK